MQNNLFGIPLCFLQILDIVTFAKSCHLLHVIRFSTTAIFVICSVAVANTISPNVPIAFANTAIIRIVKKVIKILFYENIFLVQILHILNGISNAISSIV